jgi:hypothetical protein
MIRHIVLLRARPDVSDARMAAIFADLPAIAAQVPGFLGFCAGRSESPEKIERGYRHGFTIDFAGWDALATYAAHPAHVRFSASLVAAAEGGIEGILVFDLPCPDHPEAG